MPNDTYNTRGVTMPGEPFGMAQSEDGSAIVVTHQTDTKTSLFTTGLGSGGPTVQPSIQFVVDGLPTGGNGIFAVPHDKFAFPSCAQEKDATACVRPAFLQTSRANAELDLIRYYSDDCTNPTLGSGATAPCGSTLNRPFIVKEASYTLTANSVGSDSRGIVIDPTPRLRCEAKLRAQGVPETDPQFTKCGQQPARVYFANRTPASVVVGEIGQSPPNGDGPYDPDRLVITGNIPLNAGPSKLYLAPIVDVDGTYAMRLFVVCFDSATLWIIDPDADAFGAIEATIRVGAGPFAMAFDPFDIRDVAARALAPTDARLYPGAKGTVRRYRFAYIASFTNSYVQLIDLDDAQPVPEGSFGTFETVVFNLGDIQVPKGSR
jgi:hypothetical protein